MKRLYYRAEKVSKASLIAMLLTAIGCLLLVSLAGLSKSKSIRLAMLDAAYRSEAAFDAIHQGREELGCRMLKLHDPAETGMLGPSMSLVTTLPGHLDAKQTSVNPNFAAVVIRYLTDIGAKPGDHIAIGCTGSFPALNIATITAVESLGLQPILVSSAASSQYGANDPDFMWPDMERLLYDQGIISTRSKLTTRGGFRDDAVGMTDDTREKLDESIRRSGSRLNESEDMDDAIFTRMKLYANNAPIQSYVAYINVGGGSASVGGSEGNEQFGGGLTLPSDLRSMPVEPVDSVATRFLNSNVAFINMVDVVKLAKRHGLPVASVKKVDVNIGSLDQSKTIQRPLALLAIIVILAHVYLIMRPPLWWTTFCDSRSSSQHSLEKTNTSKQFMV